MSAILRRLLVNREIQEIAGPRIGRFFIDAPDEKPFIRYVDRLPSLFAATAGAKIWFRDGEHYELQHLFAVELAQVPRPPEPDPKKRVLLRVDNFIGQPVFYIHGAWVTRTETIKFVANLAGGVHSGSPKTDDEKRLASVRRSVRFAIGATFDGRPIAEFRLDALTPGPDTLEYSKDRIDPLLVELIATTTYLCKSESTAALEKLIMNELGG